MLIGVSRIGNDALLQAHDRGRGLLFCFYYASKAVIVLPDWQSSYFCLGMMMKDHRGRMVLRVL